MEGKRRLRAMGEETSALITASYIVPDIVVAVQEAVYNAIDAGARHVKVMVDVAQASFTVTDDGHGIHPDEMYEHIFESSATSKSASTSRKCSGRGQFLMALATLAKEVELESRVENHWAPSRKLVQIGRVVFNANAKTSQSTKGTRLRVDNLFSLLPVRQRELASHASARSRVTKRLSSFFHSLSMIWPSLSIDVSYADVKAARIAIQGVATCEERILGLFGEILGGQMEYVSFEADDSPFTVRGYVAVIQDGTSGHAESLQSPGWKQARAYYQFVFLDNTWMDDFQRNCCKTLNATAMELEIGIPIFVLKVSSRSHEYELHSDGDTRVVHFKRPEVLTQTLKGFIQALRKRILEAEDCAVAVASSKEASELDVKPELKSHTPEVEPPATYQYPSKLPNQYAYVEVYAPTMDTEVQYEADRRADWTKEVFSRNAERYFTDCEGEWFIDDDNDGENEQPFEHSYYRECEYDYEYEDVVAKEEYAGEREQFEVYSDSYNPTDAHEMPTQDTMPRGCTHCSCGRSQAFEKAYLTPSPYEIDVRSIALPEYTADYHTQLEYYDDDPDDEFHLAVCEEDDAFMPHPNVASSTTARIAALKEEGSLNELYFGSNALHQARGQTKKHEVTVARKLEEEFDEEIHTKPQAQWLSSRRLGAELADDDAPSIQLHVDLPSRDHDEQEDATHDVCGVNADSNQLSEYFSFGKLAKTYKQPTASAIARFASKRAAFGGTLAPLPGETATGVRGSRLPHDLHSPSAKTMTLDKSIFQNLQVIKQVDRKFILVKVTQFSGSDRTADADEAENILLLCIDQHAADERVRLELLEAQVFGAHGDEKNVETVEQQQSLPVSLNQRERETLAYFEVEIRSWGFGFDTDEHTTWLTHTPKIDTRVANADDFREYLQLLSRSDPYVARRVLRPPVITRFLHSRACRSAIMFGDYLSRSQCQDIVDQLSQCQLPFQCAHGRPSIVPLVELI